MYRIIPFRGFATSAWRYQPKTLLDAQHRD